MYLHIRSFVVNSFFHFFSKSWPPADCRAFVRVWLCLFIGQILIRCVPAEALPKAGYRQIAFGRPSQMPRQRLSGKPPGSFNRKTPKNATQRYL
jgi:hypothetical protein